eukprot:SAG31_NODE_32055_length_360_cov_1.379310_1_plen_57_part_10
MAAVAQATHPDGSIPLLQTEPLRRQDARPPPRLLHENWQQRDHPQLTQPGTDHVLSS